MLAGFAANNATAPGGQLQWKADNPQLLSRENMISFLNSNSNSNRNTRIVPGTSAIGGQPYVLHTTNEFYANMYSKIPYGNGEKFHIVAVRKGPLTASDSLTSGLKVVYYYEWDDTYSSPPVFTPMVQPTATFSEYYNLSTDPGELTNNSSSITSAMHTAFSGLINTEMQAAMATVNGIDLDTVLAGAQTTYNNYMSPPDRTGGDAFESSSQRHACFPFDFRH